LWQWYNILYTDKLRNKEELKPYPANMENMVSSYQSNASKWQMGFNSAFKGLIYTIKMKLLCITQARGNKIC
jgi:hypothetical protein